MPLWVLILAVLMVYPSRANCQIGVEAGAAYTMSQGSFRAPCGCIFQNGTGIGFTAEVLSDIVSSNDFTFGMAFGFDQKNFTAYEHPADPLSGDQLDVQMRYLSFKPYLRYQMPNSGLFFEAAPEAERLLSNSFKHTSRPVPHPSEDNDSTMGDLRTMRYAALISAGYTVNIWGMRLAPKVTADFALNNIREDASLDAAIDNGVHGANGWRITSVHLSIAAFFNL